MPIAAAALLTFHGVFYFDDLRAILLADTTSRPAIIQPVPPTEDQPEQRLVRLFVDGQGHFQTIASVNNHLIDFVIDTGASLIALRYEDAQKAGLTDNLTFSGATQTANGISKVAPITIPVLQIGKIRMTNLRAHIARPGKLSVNLLGMNFIRRLARFEMRGAELVLVQAP